MFPPPASTINSNTPPFYLHIYWEGTGFARGQPTMASALADITQHDENSAVIHLDGCGVAKNLRRFSWFGISGSTLEEQADNLVETVKQILYQQQRPLIINAYGFSRAGVGLFLLCRKLNDIFVVEKQNISMNIVTFDPVPGNAQITARLGALKTLAEQVMDLTDCSLLKNVCILYGIGELDNAAENLFYSPVLPRFSPNTQCYIDVMFGTHALAQQMVSAQGNLHFLNAETLLIFDMVFKFLRQHNTYFNPVTYSLQDFTGAITLNLSTLQACYASMLVPNNFSRILHGEHTLRYQDAIEVSYFNKHHQAISLSIMDKPTSPFNIADNSQVKLRFEQKAQTEILNPPEKSKSVLFPASD